MTQGIVIQGPTDYYKEVADHYSHFDNVVWATWNDESKLHLDYIKSKGIQVVLVEKPEFAGYINVNMQVKSTFEGIKALEGKVDNVLKVRSDTIISNLDLLLQGLKNKPLSFMALAKEGARKDIVYNLEYYHTSHDYPADNVIYGPIEDMSIMFDFQIQEMAQIPPEALIAWNYMTNKGIKFNLNFQHLLDNNIGFFMDICLDKEVGVHWLKRDVNLVDWYKDKTIYDW